MLLSKQYTQTGDALKDKDTALFFVKHVDLLFGA